MRRARLSVPFNWFQGLAQSKSNTIVHVADNRAAFYEAFNNMQVMSSC
jgi:hypothetical protein